MSAKLCHRAGEYVALYSNTRYWTCEHCGINVEMSHKVMQYAMRFQTDGDGYQMLQAVPIHTGALNHAILFNYRSAMGTVYQYCFCYTCDRNILLEKAGGYVCDGH